MQLYGTDVIFFNTKKLLHTAKRKNKNTQIWQDNKKNTNMARQLYAHHIFSNTNHQKTTTSNAKVQQEALKIQNTISHS